MKNFSNHIKGIAYLLSTLTLFQSCVVYNKTPSTIEEATSDKEMPIKVITKDGHEYLFRLIEEMDGNIIGFEKAEKEYLFKKDIFQYAILFPEPHTVPMDSALNHNGTIRILTNNRFEGLKSREFMKIIENDDKIIGYIMKDKHDMPVIIPIDQIDQILLKDNTTSSFKTIGVVFGLTFGIGLLVMGIVLLNDNSAGWDGI